MNKLDFLKLSKEQVKLNPYDGPAKYLNTLRKSNNANEKTIAGNQDTVTSTQDKPKLSTQILGTLKNIAKDPSTYSKLASVASVVAAAEGENTAADALSNISSRIDQNVRSRDTAKATVEAQKIKSQADAEKAALDREALKEAARLRGLAAKKLEESKYKPPTDFVPANEFQTFFDDPRAQKINLFTVDKETGNKYVNNRIVEDYLDKKDLAKSKLQANIVDAKIRNEQINKVITDPKLQEIIGTVDVGPLSVRKEFIASLGGTPEEVQTLLSIINTTESNKVLETLKKLKSQSRTGATGFGALNQEELGLISKAFIDLNKAQDFKTFVTKLKLIDKTFSDATQREQTKYLEDYKGEGIELYQNPYKQVASKTKTQDKSVSQPEIKGYKLVEN